MPSDYLEMLTRVAVPTLVAVGREDEFTPVSAAELMHERIPRSRLAVIEGAAHLPNLEREIEFNRALQSFLEWVDATARRGESLSAASTVAIAAPPAKYAPRISGELAEAGEKHGLTALETAAFDRLGVSLA